MWKAVIKDVHPDLDGEYPLEWEFKKREWRTIKKIADVTPLELVRELKRGNMELNIALVAVALEQARKPYIEEMLWADEGTLQLVEEKDADASPPEQPQSGGRPSELNKPSGATTSGTSEPSQATTTGNGSGTPDSVTPAISGPATLAT